MAQNLSLLCGSVWALRPHPDDLPEEADGAHWGRARASILVLTKLRVAVAQTTATRSISASQRF